MKKLSLGLLLCLLTVQTVWAQGEATDHELKSSSKLKALPHNFEELRIYLNQLSQNEANVIQVPIDPSPYELLGLVEHALESPELQAYHSELKEILKLSESWLQNERLDLLEERSDLTSFDLNQFKQRFENIESELPFKVFGSLAFRSCSMMNTDGDIVGAVLQTRFGAGLRGQFHPDWDYGLRLISMHNDNFNLSWFPFDTNDNLMRVPLNLDRYFIGWRPVQQQGWIPEFKLTLGKALNPLPESQLLYDEDVSFNGLQESFRWKNPMPHLEQLSLDLGQHPLLTQGTFITSSLFSGKLRSDWRWGDWQLRTGGSYNHYLGSDRFANLNFNQGYIGAFSARNRLDGEDAFASDFQILNGFGRLTWNGIESLPISLLGDYARNLGAADQNNGGLIGVQLGQMHKPGDWQFNYAYRYMQQDFNLSLMIDDFYSGTDVAGHTFRLGAQITDNNAAHITLVTRQSLSRPEAGHLFILYTSLQQSF